MTTHAVTRRTRYIQLGVPAAVLGTLSAAIAATPAAAEAVSPTIERLQSTPTRIAPAEAPPASYTVHPGDTISSIASRFGLRTVDVLTWNGLGWRSVIYPGQALALTAGAAPVAPAAPTPTGSAATHTVAAGDTVFSIAQRHGTSVDAVLAANGLTRASVIYPGQQLALAGSSAPPPAAAVAPAAPAPVAAGGQTHAVAAGDTLFAIAKKHGTTVAQLYALNGMTPGAIIYPGQSLVVAAAPVAAPAPAAVATAPPAQLFANLDAEQAGNASVIIRVGRDLGVPDRAIAIALATAMVESSMRNLSWGDRDSLGLFQQRPSMGWGTPEQAVDPDRSTRVFYGGSADPNGPASRGLLDIPGWESLRFTDAAQAVQISAYPERYGQWETQSFQWLGQHG
ncbi:LysM peptidoglycan-binding domain-containing protein [Microbacterium sp. APC 3901]|uniref:LysM peptidoglycan-binding domain-containing protein n=1 Tax=Microbacterium sp. APC 3901 TaxID=3035192 RepID=UPI0025B41EDE|nr:LysM peptidoglycan-binding domain-containing protein [Microbacterium sp. APC 3901]MDN3444946.1 LysM peptidoglycan-binding domain-containing protein [Microbacterium sp. APC 3901]